MIRSSVSFPRRGTRWLSTLTGVNTSSIVSSGRIRHPRQQQQRQHVPRSQRNASVVVMDPVSYMTTNAAATTTATATATMMTTANRKLNDVIFSSCRRRYHGDSHSSRNGSSSSSSSSSHQDPQSFYNETQKRIMQKTKELHASIMPLNERVRVREGWSETPKTNKQTLRYHALIFYFIFDIRKRKILTTIAAYALDLNFSICFL